MLRKIRRHLEIVLQERLFHLAQLQSDYYHKGRLERDWDLAQAIKNLPVKQRTVIVLHYYSGMTLPEMTQTLRISENTLKKRIQAALSNLRRTLRASDMDDAYAPTSTRSNPNRFAMSPA